ncbi:hypothetical protein CRG98_018461 [Punica granatum]|uniref:Aspartic peptidase DDI1-type domain-containing protein n=1 Tax=Punica granatum TaxID=22663 RepID=A0A2I0JXX0_PUNGR|nr:hypothetical protein CRG98_018461 [Punica granatum]
MLTLPANFMAKEFNPRVDEVLQAEVIHASEQNQEEAASPRRAPEAEELNKRNVQNFIFKRVPEVMSQHLRPLFITIHMFGVHVPKVMVDNGATINVMPTSTMAKHNYTEEDLVKTGVTITDFKGVVTNAWVNLSVNIQVGSRITTLFFLFLDASTTYNALLG